jgi:hypothetical protein
MPWPMSSTGAQDDPGLLTPLEVYAQHLQRLSLQADSVH